MYPLRVNDPGLFFHLTARGNNRENIFPDDEDKLDYLFRLEKVFSVRKIRLVAFCIMSNHIHLLCYDKKGGNVPIAMQRLQSSYARSWNRRNQRTGHVFERRYYATVVESGEYLISVANYIHLNPVRAGILSDCFKYYWSSAGAYQNESNRSLSGLFMWCDPVLDLFSSRSAYLTDLADVSNGASEDIAGQVVSIRGVSILGSDEFQNRFDVTVDRRAKSRPTGMTLEDIISVVSKETGIGFDEICGLGSSRQVSTARSRFCELALREGFSGVQISRMINRSSSTVFYAAKRSASALSDRAQKVKEKRS